MSLCASFEKERQSQSLKASAADKGGDEHWRQWCGDLLKADPAEVGTGTQWLRLSAAQGNGAALYFLSGDDASGESKQQRLTELHRAIDTLDPEVVDSLVVASFVRDKNAEDSKTDMFAVEALTKCALGYDCTASGPLYNTLWCKKKGCLHADSVERFYELSMSPTAYAAARDYSQTLAAEMHSGRYDWPAMQELEDRLPGGELADGAPSQGETSGDTAPQP